MDEPQPYQARRTRLLPLFLGLGATGLLAWMLLRQPTINEEYMDAQRQYLLDNATKEGVVTTASGLQIRHLDQGEGPSPGPRDRVTVHYEGRLIDGTVFDSSYQRGQAMTFGLDQVIAGWTEGLQLMKVGGTAELTIPSSLGYGARGAGGVIPGGATLVFKVELLGVH